MTPIEFTIHGIPKGAGSKRPMVGGNGRAYLKDMGDEKGEVWSQLVNAAARAAHSTTPLTGPLAVEVEFRFPRPKKHFHTGRRAGILRTDAPEWVSGRTDIDKLLRRLFDAITGTVWDDDTQVASVDARKRWSTNKPGATVRICPLCTHTAIDADRSEPEAVAGMEGAAR